DANLWWQARKSGVSERNGNRVCGQRHPGYEIAGQPNRPISAQPIGWWKPPIRCRSFLISRNYRHEDQIQRFTSNLGSTRLIGLTLSSVALPCTSAVLVT